MITKKLCERTQTSSHIKTASNSFWRKTWKRCGNGVPTRSCSTQIIPYLCSVFRFLPVTPIGLLYVLKCTESHCCLLSGFIWDNRLLLITLLLLTLLLFSVFFYRFALFIWFFEGDDSMTLRSLAPMTINNLSSRRQPWSSLTLVRRLIFIFRARQDETTTAAFTWLTI